LVDLPGGDQLAVHLPGERLEHPGVVPEVGDERPPWPNVVSRRPSWRNRASANVDGFDLSG
jgi:hypothetical protein